MERLIAEKSKNGTLLFVGRRLNDAPVLALADVGLAMGAMGSDAAIEAADVVLMDDRLEKLPVAVSVARRTLAIARQNIALRWRSRRWCWSWARWAWPTCGWPWLPTWAWRFWPS